MPNSNNKFSLEKGSGSALVRSYDLNVDCLMKKTDLKTPKDFVKNSIEPLGSFMAY